MRIILRDNENVSTMLEGTVHKTLYTAEQINAAKDKIKELFHQAATTIIAGIQGRPLPERLEIELEVSNDENEDWNLYAYFNSLKSSPEALVFSMKEIVVRQMLENADTTKLTEVIDHEMCHAADFEELRMNKIISDEIAKKYDETLTDSIDGGTPDIVLDAIFSLFNHYRAEGVAIFCEQLVNGKKITPSTRSIVVFNSVFEDLLHNSTSFMLGSHRDEIYEEEMHHVAYLIAPDLLYAVLRILDRVEKSIAEKLETDTPARLTTEERHQLVRSALSLSLPEYIQGLCYITPADNLVAVCGQIQGESDDEAISNFFSMFTSDNYDKFVSTMAEILGSPMSDEEIKGYVDSWDCKWISPAFKAKLRLKINDLYSIMVAPDSRNKQKRASRWALTYFFDDQDLVFDEMPVLGLVDDMIVLDKALSIIDQLKK